MKVNALDKNSKKLQDITTEAKRRLTILGKKESDIDERIQRVKGIYDKMSDIIDSFGQFLPKKDVSNRALGLIKDKVFGNEELKKFLDDLDSHRPPRFFLIGRTGVGKSSLINELS